VPSCRDIAHALPQPTCFRHCVILFRRAFIATIRFFVFYHEKNANRLRPLRLSGVVFSHCRVG